ncbi:MAG: alpha-L-fucosidase [Anaerolineae bacterium]|nr:alpha-L-fucosidase [Anaerolineae bacterium]
MKYEPTLESIRQHQVPQWFHDAKLGIFIHWGLYSVPAWAPLTGEMAQVIAEEGWAKWFARNPYAEWYMNSMRIAGSATHQHHLETYGPNLGYRDFIPMFNEATQNWDPGAWAGLFRQVGAQYVVLTTKHHDGFLLWPSEHPNPFHPHYHARRDLVGELTEAVRAQGMKMGLYYSGGIDWTFHDLVIRGIGDLMAAIPQSADYIAYADTHWRELTARYQPSVMWNDIGYPAGANLPELFAHYYNAVPDGVINDRFAQFRTPRNRLVRALFKAFLPLLMRLIMKRGGELPASVHSDFKTPEYASFDQIVEKKWESTRGIGYSFGYNRNEGVDNYLSVRELVHSFVDIVSKNGNLLLNVGPMADGTIVDMQRERLIGLGNWLRVNGEAIYGSRPWNRADGKTGDGIAVRFTQREGCLYAVVLDERRGDQVRIDDLQIQENSTVHLLGHDAALSWQHQDGGLAISLPPVTDNAPAFTLKIEPLPTS